MVRFASRANRALLLFALITLVLASSASLTLGQAVVFFDETGTFAGGSFGPLPSSFGTDPLATGGPTFPTATLFYTLPFPVATGDVQLTEPPTGISDMVRFEGNRVFFYSDNLDGSNAPADVGLPLLLTPTPVVLAESGSEGGFQQAIYTPAPGGPGDPGFPIMYNIISDVPEPVSSAVLAGAFGLLALRRRVS